MSRSYVVLHLAPEGEGDRAHNEEKRYSVVPLQVFSKVQVCKYREHAKRDNFLDDFQLERGEFAETNAIGGHLEAILEERNQPADQNRGNQRRFAILEMTVPSDGHENVRADEK